MTRPSTRAVRRAATDLSEQVTPHLSTAKEALVGDVLPKVKPSRALRRKAKAAGLLPKAKAAGVGVAVKAGLMEAPKKRHPWRMIAIAGALAAAAYAAWNAWRLPHGSEDWSQADNTADSDSTADGGRTDSQVDVPADNTHMAR